MARPMTEIDVRNAIMFFPPSPLTVLMGIRQGFQGKRERSNEALGTCYTVFQPTALT